jgi:Sap, sulfolipid-1-addressing protein
MGLILPMVFLGLMASLSPATIVVFVLVLGTAQARVNAIGFLFGWGLSLTIVFAASYALADTGWGRRGDGRTAVLILEILLGAGLLVASIRLWRRETTDPTAPTVPEGSTSAAGWGTQRLMSRMDSLTPFGAAVVGVLKQPWAITTAAALVLVHNQTTGLLAAIGFALFTIASTATVLLMFVYYARYPGEAQTRLADLRDRAVAAGPAVGAVAGMLVAGFLILDGLLGLR